eukprot:s826_g7.t1
MSRAFPKILLSLLGIILVCSPRSFIFSGSLSRVPDVAPSFEHGRMKLRGVTEGSTTQWPAMSCGILLAGLAASGARAKTQKQKTRTVVRAESILSGLGDMKRQQEEEEKQKRAGAAEQSKGVPDNSDMDQFMDKDFDETDLEEYAKQFAKEEAEDTSARQIRYELYPSKQYVLYLAKKNAIKTWTSDGPDGKNRGCLEVQIAIATEKIRNMILHMREFRRDYKCRLKLTSLVCARRRMLDKLASRNLDSYMKIREELKIRHVYRIEALKNRLGAYMYPIKDRPGRPGRKTLNRLKKAKQLMTRRLANQLRQGREHKIIHRTQKKLNFRRWLVRPYDEVKAFEKNKELGKYATRPPTPAEPAEPEPQLVPVPPRSKPPIEAAGSKGVRRRIRPQTAPCRRAPTAAEVGLNMRRVKLFVFQWKRRTKDRKLKEFVEGKSDQFLRGLTSLIHPRSLDDAENPIDPEVIMDFFEASSRLQGQPRLVDVRRFCEEVETVFGLHSLEKVPLQSVPEPGHSVFTWKGWQPKPPSDPVSYEKLLKRIRVLCQARGIELTTCLDDTYWSTLDAKAGRLRPDHFLRTFPLTRSTPTVSPAFSQEEMQPIMERFTDVDGFFRIFLFQKEVEEFVCETERAPPPMHASTSPGFPLQRYRRPQSARVRSIYAKQGVDGIQDDQWDATDLQRQRPQTARASRPEDRPALPARPRTAGATGRHYVKPEIMTTLRSRVLTHRVRLWDSFQDFDRLRRGVVPQIGFKNALNTMGLNLSLSEMLDLYNRYRTPENHFCYHDFCMDLDESVRSQIEKNLAAAGVKEKSKLHVPLEEADLKTLQKVESAVARYVKARGLDILAIFENYKKPGQAPYGHVLARSFWRAMDDINVKSLAESDLMVLCKAFNYLNFCAMVDPMNPRMPGALHKGQYLKRRFPKSGQPGEQRSASMKPSLGLDFYFGLTHDDGGMKEDDGSRFIKSAVPAAKVTENSVQHGLRHRGTLVANPRNLADVVLET